MSYPKHYQVESTLGIQLPSMNIYGVHNSEGIGSAHYLAYLPVDVPLDVEDVEEHVSVRQESCNSQWRQALHIDDPEVSAQFEGHIKHRHFVQNDHHVANVVTISV